MANEDWDEAVRRIDEAVTSGRKSLTISDLRITEIPPEISLLRRAEGKWSSFLAVPDMSLVEDVSEIGPDVGLRHINLSSTDVESLLPIESFENLRTVGIDSTQIEDLRPLLSLPKLVSPTSGKRRNGGRGVWFKETPACKDPHIARASEIEDDEERLQALLAHLRSLPPWPTPLPQQNSASGDPGEKAAPPAIQAAQAQIIFLLEHAATTSVSAATTASQIRYALKDVLATDGNKLPAVLRAMEHVAEVLDKLGTDIAKPDPEAGLRRRIAELEASVSELTRNLADAEKAREAAEVLAKTNGFWGSYRKSAGLAAGAGTVALAGVGGFSSLIYFLGADHPAIHALLTVTGKLPK